MIKSKQSRKVKRKVSRKTRRISRKSRGGAMETIYAKTLDEVKTKLAEVNPRYVILYKLKSKEHNINGKKIYTDEEVKGVKFNQFESLLKNYKIEKNEQLADLSKGIINKENKGKYFFQYV